MSKLAHMSYAIINKHFNFCCFRALAYTTLDRLCAVFLYNIVLLKFVRRRDKTNVEAIILAIDRRSTGRD